MRPISLREICVVAALAASASCLAGYGLAQNTDLKNVQSFASIGDVKARSLALFDEVGKVISHPRCMNCHPAGERPAQGDARLPHQPPVARGAAGIGVPGMQCNTCHGMSNAPLSGVSIASMPGNPAWALAPVEMAWQGKSLGAICEQLKDKNRNGGRDLASIHEHMAHDELVGWGWKPGDGRTPAPGSQAVFGELVQEWIKTGAECPAK